MDWFKGLSIMTKLITAAVLVAVLVGGFFTVKRFFTGGLKTEVKLGHNQHDAAVDSGHDAVETIGNRQQADAEGQRTVQETKNDISKQTDAGGVTDAGNRGLCGLASHRGRPECVHPAPPR